MNHSDASNAVDFFEQAVRAHDNMGSQPIEDHELIEDEYKRAKVCMNQVVETVAVLDRLKAWIQTENNQAQRAIVNSGYSYEYSHRTNVLREVLSQIESIEQTKMKPAEIGEFLSDLTAK